MSLGFLDDFVKQAGTGSLKTKNYPKEFSDITMRVSFGMLGVVALVRLEKLTKTLKENGILDQDYKEE